MSSSIGAGSITSCLVACLKGSGNQSISSSELGSERSFERFISVPVALSDTEVALFDFFADLSEGLSDRLVLQVIFLGVGCGNSGFESIQQGLNLCLGHSAAFRLGIRVAVRLGIRSRSRRRVVETIPSAGRIPDRGRLNGGRLRGVENV